MAHLDLHDDVLRVQFAGSVPPTYRNQLDLWYFRSIRSGQAFLATVQSPKLDRVLAYFEQRGEKCSLSPALASLRQRQGQDRELLDAAFHRAGAYKLTGELPAAAQDCVTFLREGVQRPLKLHQVKAALHLLLAENGANFSTPGSGKTAVVLAVFAFLRSQNVLDALFVVGPVSCFEPWRREFRKTLGREPDVEVFAGQGRVQRRLRYQVAGKEIPDLSLISFQTLSHDVDFVDRFLRLSGARVMLVVDEAHYMKKVEGIWASSLQRLAGNAAKRVILTGTPFPHSYRDSYNLFDFLWPTCGPLSEPDKRQIASLCDRGASEEAARILRKKIGPLFYRVRKQDLGLARQRFEPPSFVRMSPLQRRIYDAIQKRLRERVEYERIHDIETAVELKRARIIRLRQCASWPALLRTAIPEYPNYDEELIPERDDIAGIIRDYETREEPGKLLAIRDLVSGLRLRKRKIVIWSTFVGTIDLLTRTCRGMGVMAEAVYGAVKLEDRETIIDSFNDRHGTVEVIVANPAACAESVSLHGSCQDAIYYDLSYNCAQFLQSLDRIHRVGGSEQREARYRFLVTQSSIDSDVMSNVQHKAEMMRRVIDTDYPVYSLDMEASETGDDDSDAYDRLLRNVG